MGEQIISYIAYGITAISILINIFALVKSIVSKVSNKKSTDILSAIASVFDEVPYKVAEAEKIFGSGNGHAKLTWALRELQFSALKLGVEIKDEELTQKIEAVLNAPEKKQKEEVNI